MRLSKRAMRSTNRCPRCAGLLIRDWLIDYANGDACPCLSCICCGNKLDYDILANRLLHQLTT